MTTINAAVAWFPEPLAGPLLIVKGLLSVLSVVLLVFHMNQAWDTIRSSGQRARYYALFGYAVLITGATVEQASEGAAFEVSYRNLGSLIVTIGLVVAMTISIREARRSSPRGQQ